MSRRRFLQGAGAVVTAGSLALGADAAIFEPNDPEIVRVDVALKQVPETFDRLTIAQLSDFHYSDLCKIPIQRAVDKLKEVAPDLVLLTGDFVTIPVWGRSSFNKQGAGRDADACARILTQLNPRLGMFAVLGNHDRETDYRLITEILQSFSITVLRNHSQAIELENKRLWLAGVDDVLVGKADLNLALSGIAKGEPVILMAHEPDFADEACRHPILLQLSGHSHGGQVRIPGIGAPWLPPLGRQYPRGLRKVGALTLYTNIGLGTIRLPLRLNCRPEITLLKLKSA